MGRVVCERFPNYIKTWFFCSDTEMMPLYTETTQSLLNNFIEKFDDLIERLNIDENVRITFEKKINLGLDQVLVKKENSDNVLSQRVEADENQKYCKSLSFSESIRG
jgi:hypothetical protein